MRGDSHRAALQQVEKSDFRTRTRNTHRAAHSPHTYNRTQTREQRQSWSLHEVATHTLQLTAWYVMVFYIMARDDLLQQSAVRLLRRV